VLIVEQRFQEKAMEGDKKKADDNEIYEATAGWDSYVSGLVAEKREAVSDRQERPDRAAVKVERRRKPRDRTPSRRRSLLLSGGEEKQRKSDG
jgi:hypothetical protein